MSTPAQFITKDLEKDLYYVSMCYGDGYPDDTYPVLEECYNSYSKALRLCKLNEFSTLEGPISFLDVYEDGAKARVLPKSSLFASRRYADYYYYFTNGKWIWFSSIANLKAYILNGDLKELEDFYNYYVDSTCDYLGGDLCLDLDIYDKEQDEYKLSKCLLISEKFKKYFLGYIKNIEEDSYFDDTYINYFYKNYIKKNAAIITDILRYRILRKLKSGRKILNNSLGK